MKNSLSLNWIVKRKEMLMLLYIGINKIMSSKKIITFILCALMAIPVLLYFWYISSYGVNVIFWDEWYCYPLLYEKLQSGTLSFADLFAHHNEHRLFFPRIIFLILGCFSNFNTVENMYFSALLLLFTLAIIFYSYIRFFGYSEKSLLGFIPVPYLLFSLVQFENTLWGFQIAWYMLILFSVLSFVLLENIKRGYLFLVFAIISGVISSYSSLHGLLVWPVGIVYFIFRGISERDNRLFWLKISLSWIVIALLVVSLYFVNYQQPGHHPSISLIFLHPVEVLKYFLSLISAIVPIGYLSIPAAIVLGSLLLVFYFYAIFGVFKLRGVSVFYLPILLIFFSLFFDIINTIGRYGFGILYAFSSRYTIFNILGVIGIYLAFLSITGATKKSEIGRKRDKNSALNPKRNEIFTTKNNNGKNTINVKKQANTIKIVCLIILVLIILTQIALSYPYGLLSGTNCKTQRTEGAYALLNYENASNSTIERTIHPNAERFKELASICEKYKLNVFSNPPNFAYFPSNLTLSSEPTLCDVSLNGISVYQQKQPPVIPAAKEIVIEGWAVDKEASDVASAVFITIDDELDIPTIYGIDRKDVSKQYKNIKYRFSGYRASFSRSTIEEGEHKLYLKIISNDGTMYFKSSEMKFYIEYITVAEEYCIVFRDGQWYVYTDRDQIADLYYCYGAAGDIPLVEDIDDDGINDKVLFRNGMWYVDTTGDCVPDLYIEYGAVGDIPLVGDIDDDGINDKILFKDGVWYVDTNGDCVVDLYLWYGAAGDIPLVGDFNQDGTNDIAVFRNGVWYVDTIGDHVTDTWILYGAAGDIPLVGDFNQDGTNDIAVFRNGFWYVDTDRNQLPDIFFWCGITDGVPLVGDLG